MASKSPTNSTNNPPSQAKSPESQPDSSPAYIAATLGRPFLPSDAEIVEIGKIRGKGEAPEWEDLVWSVDIYTDTPAELLGKRFPSIRLRNTYLVWTPRVSRGSGFDRDLKCTKGGYWYAGRGTQPVMDNKLVVVGYFRILRFYEGGKGGKGGQLTDWCMREFFVSEGSVNDSVICTVTFENLENKKHLDALNEALKVLENNATAPRGSSLITDRAVSRGGKRASKVKGSVDVTCSANVGLVGMAPVAMSTRSKTIKPAEASGSNREVVMSKSEKESFKLPRLLIKGNKLTILPRLEHADGVPGESPLLGAESSGVSVVESDSIDTMTRAIGTVKASTSEVQSLSTRITIKKDAQGNRLLIRGGNKLPTVREQDPPVLTPSEESPLLAPGMESSGVSVVERDSAIRTVNVSTSEVQPETGKKDTLRAVHGQNPVLKPTEESPLLAVLASNVETRAERGVGSAAKRDPVDPDY